MKVRVLRPALEDLVSARIFYESREPGLGSYFIETLFSEIDALVFHAGIHRVVGGYHRKLSRHFPYAIFYKVTGDDALVFRVLDCRRDPLRIGKALGEG
jgi:plasmid stabilization system protein ParE